MLGSPSLSSVSSIPSPHLTGSVVVGANTANSSASSHPDLPYRINLANLISASAEIAGLVNGVKGNRINNPQIGAHDGLHGSQHHARHLRGNIGIPGAMALGSGEKEETGQKSGLLGDMLNLAVELSMHDALLSHDVILNPCEQVYLWSLRHCVICPVGILRAWHDAGEDVSHFDTPLIFPEGSYCIVSDPTVVGGRIYDPDDTTNNFVSFQQCVAECRFQFNNKSPSEIRAVTISILRCANTATRCLSIHWAICARSNLEPRGTKL
ncbi:hypothetical protein BT69DRAFT_1276130 [Atractiella rhizophila]|nr:hypothetical protein BT69DRAFT_1276130 [Atractiella rhizophila]